jgi:hypothetical protein
VRTFGVSLNHTIKYARDWECPTDKCRFTPHVRGVYSMVESVVGIQEMPDGKFCMIVECLNCQERFWFHISDTSLLKRFWEFKDNPK